MMELVAISPHTGAEYDNQGGLVDIIDVNHKARQLIISSLILLGVAIARTQT